MPGVEARLPLEALENAVRTVYDRWKRSDRVCPPAPGRDLLRTNCTGCHGDTFGVFDHLGDIKQLGLGEECGNGVGTAMAGGIAKAFIKLAPGDRHAVGARRGVAVGARRAELGHTRAEDVVDRHFDAEDARQR